MKRTKLKKYVLPTTLMTFGLIAVITAVLLTRINNSIESNEHLTYVSGTIISQDIAVINTTKRIIFPYTEQEVKVGKNYYDFKGTAESQEKSIIYHEDTYIQNSGVDFVYDKTFDVISILEGTVTNVKEDEVLGKIVEVTHNNDYISVYQSLTEVNVKKGDTISQGQRIGKSGNNQLDKELGNHLHFELYIGGQVVNPLDYLDKEISIVAE